MNTQAVTYCHRLCAFRPKNILGCSLSVPVSLYLRYTRRYCAQNLAYFTQMSCAGVMQWKWNARVADVDARATGDASRLITSAMATTTAEMGRTRTPRPLAVSSIAHSAPGPVLPGLMLPAGETA